MYYVYFIKNLKNKKVYVGYTNDLRRRIKEHNRGEGGKYTKNKGPFTLIYYEAYKVKEDAKKREEKLKQHKKAYTQLKLRIEKSLQIS